MPVRQTFEDHIKLSVRLTPNAGRDGIEGFESDANGDEHLKVRVTAVPEKGKANKALIALLSKTLKIPKSSFEIVSGDTARKKILRINGDPEEIVSKLDLLEKG